MDLDTKAKEILRKNDRGGFTIPTEGLYPYQWNWDSVFVALGFARFDANRAWQEIETLFEAQWPDGMIPHIVFRLDAPTYFPGPSEWQAHKGKWPSTGITQPAVAASIVRSLYETDPERARALYPKLAAYHEWWHKARDPEGHGFVAVAHPYEAGRDNLPDWDEPSKAIDTSKVGTYQRKDTDHIDASMRPLKSDYDWYVALIRFGRSVDWDYRRIAEESPFWIADPGCTAILLRAERDLLDLAKLLGEETGLIVNRIQRMEAGFDRLWNSEIKAYCSIDLRTGKMSDTATSASVLAPYAGVTKHTDDVVKLLRRWDAQCKFFIPSYDPASPRFEHKRYWRGPIWLVINYLVSQGLHEIGEKQWAERIRTDTRDLLVNEGFYEYFSPTTGEGLGGQDFSWTAAMWLAWASDGAPRMGD